MTLRHITALFVFLIAAGLCRAQTAEALIASGNQYIQRRDYAAAQRLLEEALPLVEQSGDEAALGRLQLLIGDVYASRNYFRQAIDHYRSALPLLRKTEQPQLQADCLEKMAGIQAEFGYSERAIDHLTRALKINEGLNDTAGQSFCHARLARLYFKGKKYEDALLQNREVLRLSEKDWLTASDAAIQEVIILTFLERIEDAQRSLEHARILVARHNDLTINIKVLSATSNLYLAQNDRERAKIYLDSAKTLIQGTQHPELAIDALDQMALLHQKNGDYKGAYEALQLLDRYKDIFRNNNVERITAEINDAAATALREKEIEFLHLNNQLKVSELRQSQIARAALLRENIYKDSALVNQALLLAALETESQLRQEQLEKEQSLNQALQRENALKQQNLVQERRLQRSLWFGLILFALLGGTIFLLYRKQQRNNAIIRRQSEELSVLNKEVHHRVKNNLQVISSMLDLQSQSLPESKTKGVIKEAILRVQAMAFIHQNLYLDDAANTVNMPDYISMLCDHLFHTYNIHPDRIHLHMQIEPLRLHTDTAVPLGMILNELISNALKYAFKGRQQGHVWVTLRKGDRQILLQVKDDGVGLPQGFDPAHTNSFGYEIIQAFSQKLKATVSLDSKDGTDVQLLISKFKTQQAS